METKTLNEPMDTDTVKQLLFAVESNNLDAVKNLLKDRDVNQNNENGETLLFIAVKNGNLELVKLLLSKGADYDQSSNTGITPTHLAAAKW
jgi:ankyrin repeat protein